MGEVEIGYRQERSLANIIPPDRRRAKAAALVFMGVVAGAAIFGLVDRATARAEVPPPVVIAPPPRVQSFDEIRRDGWDAVGAHSPLPDGHEDRAFALTVDGSARGIVVVQCDVYGTPARDGVRWATIDYDPAEPERSTYGAAQFGSRLWQLAVFESPSRLNTATSGVLRPMGFGVHRLEMRASDFGQLAPGAYLRAYVIGPNREVVASAPLHVTDGTTAATIAKVGRSPDNAPPPVRAFDAEAATMLLENVDVEECAKTRGATREAQVDVTFANDGAIIEVQVQSGPYPSSEAARCIVSRLGTHPLRIRPFDGAPAHVKTTYSLESE